MDETAVTVRVECNDKGSQVTGRVARIIMRLLSLADQVNGEAQGCVAFHFKGSSLTTVREYREESA